MSDIADDDEKMEQVVVNKLYQEFHAWKQNQTNQQNLELRQIIQSDHDSDEKVTMKLSIGAKEELFTMTCPLNYPNYDQESDNFFVESIDIDTDLQVWCNALNEYLLDSGRRLTLANILNKGLSLFASNDSVQTISNVSENNDISEEDQSDYDSAMDDDDESNEEEDFNIDGQMEDILDENLKKELEIGRRKKNWKLKEAQLRAEKDAENLQDDEESAIDYTDPSSSIQGRQPKQVCLK